MSKIIFVVLISLLLFSCNKKSSKVDQDQIFQNYSFSYNDDYFECSAYASFLEGDENGEALKLNKKSEVSLNGDKVSGKNTFYGRSFQDQLSNATFIYTNNSGDKFTNLLEISNAISLGTYTELNTNDTTFWSWEGEAIDTNETAYLIFTNKTNSSKTLAIPQPEIGANYFLITPSLLSSLPKETTKVEIKRQKITKQGNFGKAGGKITSTFEGRYLYVELF